MAKENVFEREIHTKEELQAVINEETGRDDVIIEEYALVEDPRVHPATNEKFSLWGATAKLTVAGVEWDAVKEPVYETVARASLAIVAYIETICCKTKINK